MDIRWFWYQWISWLSHSLSLSIPIDPYWLVVDLYTPLKNTYLSVGMMTFPSEWKNKVMFQSPPTSLLFFVKISWHINSTESVNDSGAHALASPGGFGEHWAWPPNQHLNDRVDLGLWAKGLQLTPKNSQALVDLDKFMLCDMWFILTYLIPSIKICS